MELIPKQSELAKESARLLERAQQVGIVDEESFRMAAEDVAELSRKLKFAKELFREPKAKQDEAKRALLRAEKSVVQPLEAAARTIKDTMSAYRRDLDRRREEERLRLQALADEQARREREALEKKAAKAKKEETKARYEEQASQVVAPVVQTGEPLQAEGVYTRDQWKHRVVDASQIPREFLMVDERKLASYARAMKEAASVPGVEFFNDPIEIVRSH